MSTVFELYAVRPPYSHINLDSFFDFGDDIIPDFPSYIRYRLQNLFKDKGTNHYPLKIDDILIETINSKVADYNMSEEWWDELFPLWTKEKRELAKEQSYIMNYDSVFLHLFFNFLEKNKGLHLVYKVI